VAAAEDDGNGTGLQQGGHHRAQSPLCVLQIFHGAEVAEIEEAIVGETDSFLAIGGREVIEPAADAERSSRAPVRP